MLPQVKIPPGSTFFEYLGNRSFAKLEVDENGIPTLHILEAAVGITEMFGNFDRSTDMPGTYLRFL